MSRYDIYIIYHRTDIETTRKCAQILRAQGYSCFVDFDSLMNNSFEEQVFEAINGSKCIILIYSKNTEFSQYVRREVEFAMEHGIQIIPLLLSDIDSDSWYFGKFTSPIHSPIEVLEKQLIQHVKAIVDAPDNGNESSASYSPCTAIPRDSYSTKTSNNYRWIIFVVIFVLINVILIISLTHSNFLYKYWCTPAQSEFNPVVTVHQLSYKYQYLQFICAIFFLFVLYWAFFLWRRRSKRENIKITCNKSAIVHLDGETIMEIEAHQVHKIHLSKGKYVVDFELKSDKTKHYSISINVKNTREDQIIEGTFDLLLKEKNTIKVFIAGSTRLVAERDALRSVIGQMYNKYKEDNLIVEAYSFDDFPREYTEGGHQKLYDEFIKNEADWVVFITDGTIGDKTIWELNNAIDAHKSNKRPKILMYSKPELENSSSKMDSFRKLLNEENQYWIDYTSPNEIKSTFREHLQWDLYNLMKNQYAA